MNVNSIYLEFRVIVFVIIAFLFIGLSQVSANQMNYASPNDIILDLRHVPESKTASSSDFVFSATVKGVVGVLSNVQIFFESSRNLITDPKSASLKSLFSGESKNYLFRARVNGKIKPDRGGTWIRLRVVYLPDFKAIIDKINGDLSTYSHKFERERLIRVVAEAQKKGETITRVVRVFSQTPKK